MNRKIILIMSIFILGFLFVLIPTIFNLTSTKVNFNNAVELDVDRNGAIDIDKGGTNTKSLEEFKKQLGLK